MKRDDQLDPSLARWEPDAPSRAPHEPGAEFRAMFEASTIGMCQADQQGRYLRVNRAFCDLLGYSPEELLGRSFLEFTHPDHRAADEAGFRRFFEGQTREFKVEKRYLRKDGSVVWVHVTVNLVRDPRDRPLRTVAIVQDVTARRQAEEAQREAVRQYEQQVRLFEGVTSTTPDFVYLFDLNGCFLYANRRLLEVWGMELPHIIGKTCRQLGYEQWHHDMHMREIAQVIQTKQPIKGEVPFKAPVTGTFGIYEYIFTPVFSPDGEVELIAGTTRDVTERKLAEEALREREQRYRELFTSMTEGFCVIERMEPEPGRLLDYRYVEANPAFAAQSGIRDVLGKTIREVLPSGETAEWIDTYDRVAVTGKSIRFERRLGAQDRWLELYAYRVGTDQKQRVGVVFRDVTERHHAERKLRDQLRLTETIANGAGEALFLVDQDGRLTFMNPAAERMLGWRRDELTGRVLQEIIHSEHPDGTPLSVASQPFIQALASGVSFHGQDAVFHARDGRAIPVRCSNAPVLESGRNAGSVLVVADVTEQKRAEEQLRRNHDTFYHLIQNNPFGIYVVDADFRLRQISIGAQKVFSNVRPLLGRDFAEILRTIWAEPFATEAIELFRHTLETGEPYSSYSTIERRQDIETVEAYDWRIERLTLPDGRFGVVCYFYDLSERQRWEESLRLSEQRFQLAVRATNDATWDWDLATNSLWWNDSIETVYGHRADQVGPAIDSRHDLIHPGDYDRVVRGIQQVLAGEESLWRAEYRFRRADGSYADVYDRGYVMRDAAGKPIRMLGAMQDLSDRKRAEAALADAQEELRQYAGRLEQEVTERTARLRDTIAELETLSYSISHDMRAPLRAMHGFSQALLDDYKDRLDQEGVSYLQRITAAAQRLDALIQDILLYTGVARDQLVISPVALEPLIREIIQTYHPHQSAQITVEPPIPNVLGHEAFLSQIISNLITNALKFVPEGQAARVRLYSEREGDRVKLWVEDRGIGIAPQHLQRIFQVFGRLHTTSEYPGTGIGLAIVKRAVERLGGEVGVESTIGRGSRFWISFPAAE